MIYEDKKIRMQEQALEYKRGFKWHILPYDEITHAYLRIEEVRGRICCCVANFDMHFLVVKTEAGEMIKMEASSREAVKRMLKELEERNPSIEIGCKKQES